VKLPKGSYEEAAGKRIDITRPIHTTQTSNAIWLCQWHLVTIQDGPSHIAECTRTATQTTLDLRVTKSTYSNPM
jgi:hypothetical protein